jgi:hypothetical protein
LFLSNLGAYPHDGLVLGDGLEELEHQRTLALRRRIGLRQGSRIHHKVNESPGDLRPLIILQEVAGLRQTYVLLARRTGNKINEILLRFTGPEIAGIVCCPDGYERLLKRGEAGDGLLGFSTQLIDDRGKLTDSRHVIPAREGRVVRGLFRIR